MEKSRPFGMNRWHAFGAEERPTGLQLEQDRQRLGLLKDRIKLLWRCALALLPADSGNRSRKLPRFSEKDGVV